MQNRSRVQVLERTEHLIKKVLYVVVREGLLAVNYLVKVRLSTNKQEKSIVSV